MPTYDYVCDKGHVKEILHSIFDSPRFYCHCGKPLKRTVSAPVVQFNGEGFYSTDK